MHAFLIHLKELFKKESNPEKAAWVKAYLHNQFEHYGIVTATRRKLSKEYFKQHPINSIKEVERIVKECFTLSEREYQYFAVELLAFYKKIWEPNTIKILEYCLVTKSWWDTVDHVASECLSDYFKIFPEQITSITSKWNTSTNIWLQRSSIMFQKAYKQNTNTTLLSKYILQHTFSKEFFIQKAIGWALREYSRTNPNWVKQFVKENQLPSLSIREALKTINKN